MDAERWQQIRSVFNQLVELEPERLAVLRRAAVAGSRKPPL
jgi:hypothetical protein